jgi:hypothetical protein
MNYADQHGGYAAGNKAASATERCLRDRPSTAGPAERGMPDARIREVLPR